MPLVNADRVQETTTTTGTGVLTLAGAVAGFRTFASGVGNGNTCYYALEAVDTDGVPTGDWEVGLGTVGSGTLTRTTVHASSNGGAAVNLAAGTKRVYAVWSATALPALFAQLAAANTFSTGPQVLVGGATIQQSGGTPGTDEVRHTHTASGGLIDCRAGTLTLRASGAGDVVLHSPSGNCMAENAFIPKLGINGWNGQVVGLAVAGNVSNDALIVSPLARVIRVAGSTTTTPGTLSSVPLSPSQITGDQNDYAPGVARYYRLSTDASRTITGLSVGQVDGQECEVWNVGAQNLVLANESASSSAANRFTTTTGANLTLTANQMAFLRWFSADSSGTGRWRVVKGP